MLHSVLAESSHLDDGLQHVQDDEVGLGGQIAADEGLLVQLCLRSEKMQEGLGRGGLSFSPHPGDLSTGWDQSPYFCTDSLVLPVVGLTPLCEVFSPSEVLPLAYGAVGTCEVKGVWRWIIAEHCFNVEPRWPPHSSIILYLSAGQARIGQTWTLVRSLPCQSFLKGTMRRTCSPPTRFIISPRAPMPPNSASSSRALACCDF